MAKRANHEPSRTCEDCFHFSACHLWAVSISTDVAPKCPQFEPARYASLADLHEMHQMAKGELVPVVHGRWVHEQRYGDSSGWVWRCSACRIEAISPIISALKYCHSCGAKMDAKEE